MIYLHDRVVVFAHWHSFRGCKGRVTQPKPLMVLLDGDTYAMAIEERAVVRESDSEMSLTGAE